MRDQSNDRGNKDSQQTTLSQTQCWKGKKVEQQAGNHDNCPSDD
jgi:hypothetical protein